MKDEELSIKNSLHVISDALDTSFGTIRVAATYYDKKPHHCKDVWDDLKEKQDSSFKAIAYLKSELGKMGLLK